MKPYKMTITILSPVHIGSGADIDPLEYVVKDGVFYRLNLPAFLSQMDASRRAEFNQKANDPNPLVLRDFICRHIAPERYCCFKADGGAFEPDYRSSLQNPQRRLEVNLFTRTPGNWQAYLPGSSIKGAIRTAVISELANSTNHKSRIQQELEAVEQRAVRRSTPQDAEKKWNREKSAKSTDKELKKEQEKFGKYKLEPLALSQPQYDPRTDPFRCLKISDALLPEAPTFIDKAEIFKLNEGKDPDPAGIQMFYEQCFSMLDGETICAAGTLHIDDKLPLQYVSDKRQSRKIHAVSMKLEPSFVAGACRAFYLPKMQAEHNKFYRSNPEVEQYSQQLLDVKYEDNEFPLRLGRFSHVECTTVDTFRRPHNPKGWGSTRTLSAGRMPMGWVKVSLEPLG
jgi:CRISPR-associated protein Csm5